ncbi:MAG: WG repeat-containing protein [Prevotellaceae bacterium]|nr:WG repeat-containing protein [Prevotellaceae bacterium]
MRTKITSMKRVFILFWHGLTALLVGIANWFTVILGMRDDSKYGKILRRTVGSCFAFLMLLLAIAAGWDFCRTACYRLEVNKHFDDSYYDTQYISRNVTYYTYYDEDGYLKTSDGKKTITGIRWIAKPLGMDSLICYSDGKKRGYFNMFTGKTVIEPKYSHAWIFSDGLASVDDGGWIKFIDASGKVVIDPQIPYIPGAEGYVFHKNRCIAHNERRDRFGLLDKQGKWVLQPEYFSIESSGNFWVVDNGEGKSVLDSTLNTVIPFTKGQIWVSSEYICVTLSNHIIQRYDHSGEIINDFYINDVSYMTYESDELRYSTSKNYNEEGTLTSETENIEPLPVEKMAKCRRYEAESGWYGLMTADGKVITPPSYCSIQAIGYDMYLCKDNDEDGVILNGKGQRIS